MTSTTREGTYSPGPSLSEVIRASASETEGRFDFAVFYRKWFKEFGRAYFFLFTKNLGVTNIQYAELFSLLNLHILKDDVRDPAVHLQFLSVDEFRLLAEETFRTFETDGISSASLDVIDQFYGGMFAHIVVIDAMFGSCSVMIPPGLTLALHKICAESGYIHSCGRNVYLRNITKVTEHDFIESILNYVKAEYRPDEKLLFVVYCHEDFTVYDRERASELESGLDEVKLHIEKLYFGDESLVHALNALTFGDPKAQIVVPPPGDYRSHGSLRKQPGVRQQNSLWLIGDRGSGDGRGHPGDERYLICYDQQYMNQNPFHLFDENKPAWISHTTIPHTLVGAAINATRPSWPATLYPRVTMVADPFVGTGTTWLEAVKFTDRLKCGDKEPLTPVLAKDNLTFFTLQDKELASIREMLDKLAEKVLDLEPPNLELSFLEPSAGAPGEAAGLDFPKVQIAVSDADRAFNRVAKYVEKLEAVKSGIDWEASGAPLLSPHELEKFKKMPLFDRLIFYIFQRVLKRHLEAINREAERFPYAFHQETRTLVAQIDDLLKLRQTSSTAEAIKEGCFRIFTPGDRGYSTVCTIDLDWLREISRTRKLGKQISQCEVEALKGTFDLIVADPPYGINSTDQPEDLARLYYAGLKAMISSLNDGGQLILSLVDRVHTGRHSMFFTHKEFIEKQVQFLARELGKEVVVPPEVVPHPGGLFRPPYYWESSRALRRAILHFRFINT